VSQVLTISDREFETAVLQEVAKPVLAYFWADWCGPCRLMSPSIDWASETYADRLKVVKLEVDPNPESVKRCQVEGVPALVIYRAGDMVATAEGAIGREKLAAFLDQHLESAIAQ
jgi:thioredoxin 1